MTVRELMEFLAGCPGDWMVSVALPNDRIEKLERAEVDPYTSDEEGVLLWAEGVTE
jgi:hypothetical protein